MTATLHTLSERRHIVLDDVFAPQASVDLAVVGLGTAGADALITGAQLGLSCLGVERQHGPGGLMTLGCVWDYYYGSCGGRWQELDRQAMLLSRVGNYTQCQSHPDEGRCIPGIVRTAVLEQAALRAGAELAYETTPCGVWLDGNIVCGLRLLRRGVVRDVAVAVVIDASAEGAVLRLAGGTMIYGREWDGAQMAFSKTIGDLNNGLARGCWAFCGFLSDPSAEELSRAILAASTKGPLKRKYGNGTRLLYNGAVLGQREEGHALCEDMLTWDDALAGKTPAKPLFYTFTPQDLTNMNGDYAYESDTMVDWRVLCGMQRYGFSAALSYDALLPKGLDGLLVAGKIMGLDHDLGGGLRMERDFRKAGEAAAVAAALAKKHGVAPRDVPYDELAAELRASGCLNEEWHCGIADLHGTRRPNGVPVPAQLPQTAAEYIAALSRDIVAYRWHNSDVRLPAEEQSPALALWAARELRRQPAAVRKAICDGIYAELSKDGPYVENLAIALGLAGDGRACAQLRQSLASPRPVPAGAYPNRIKALCLLGRLGDGEAVPLLLALVEDYAAAFCADLAGDGGPYAQANHVNNALSYALFALAAINDRYHPAGLAARLRQWSQRPFVLHCGLNGDDRAPMLRDIVQRRFA
ncbi:FAD-dependent oxidoreductase [Oligosphaera ethanolica]|uniref:FAD-dependent oxidoreductase n=1 Tax=Oligosphaera ethanolica TaxID=760260 RepID=A0AAE3VIH0_9BACT|nr:FAD-dependent oxidoreductase [Oligosphaera ethanolica]MDQ0291337.1 hypothetical protein [Oligosphaera ethanolica]